MKIFKEFFEDQEQRVETVALLPGGYKPPTKGHYNALKYLMQDADRAVVFIGNKDRDGITAEHSKRIWETYAKYFDKPVDIAVSEVSPVKSVYDFADENPELAIIVGAGAKDEDIKRYKYFEDNIENYPLVSVIKIPIQSQGISGTKTRKLIQQYKDDLQFALEYFIPEEVSIEDRQAIEEILRSN